jgi:hypothetical protein
MMSISIKQGTLFYIYLEKLLPAVVLQMPLEGVLQLAQAVVLQVVPPLVLPLHVHL